MRSLLVVLALLVCGGLVAPPEASSQLLSVGPRASWNGGFDTGSGEGVFGLGVQASVKLPLLGLALRGTADLYFPDCGAADCDLRDFGIEALFSPPIPFLDPYLGAGLAIVDSGGELGDERDLGLSLVAGVGVSRLFAEGKLQLLQDFDTQFVLTGGLTLPVL